MRDNVSFRGNTERYSKFSHDIDDGKDKGCNPQMRNLVCWLKPVDGQYERYILPKH